jgi:NADH:ubiquinone oxidoreductase subunit E
MTINDRVYPAMTKEKATELIKKLKEDGDVK